MKRKLLLVLIFTWVQIGFSQEMYLKLGSNFTKYRFETNGSPMNTPFQSAVGNSFSIGRLQPINSKWAYTAEINLNDYNASASSAVSSYKWTTKYLGLQSNLQYNIVHFKNFLAVASAGLNVATIVYGKQESNGQLFDLKKQDEFSGLKLIPVLGFSANYRFSTLGQLSLGYYKSRTVRLEQSEKDKTTFNTTQLLFGIHFNIKN
jgi:hypothetical protein